MHYSKGCAQDDLSGGYRLAKVVAQKCSIIALFMLDGGAKLARVVVKSGCVVVGLTITDQCGHLPV